jgi:hypothetical protein
MTARGQLLAALLALAGHGLGVVGFPVPTAPPAEPQPTAAKTERTCHCACGGTCGETCCCCSGGQEAADPEPSPPSPPKEAGWSWAASIQIQQCRGDGPAGFAELPPAVTMRPQYLVIFIPPAGVLALSTPVAVMRSAEPPTPPPRPI